MLNRNPKDVRRFRRARAARARWLAAVCGLLLAPDLLGLRHEYFGFADFFGFYALVAVGGGVSLVLAARFARYLLVRPEDYYEEDI